MTPEKFTALLSAVKQWMRQTLKEYEDIREPVVAAGFSRLAAYYPADLLQSVGRVIVDRCPSPPLGAIGLHQLAEIQGWDLKGVPWKDTVFIRRDLAGWDAVHFHELLHIVQWQYLGTDRYLTAWAIGTIIQGYRANPLEEMAFRHQERFEAEEAPYDVVQAVAAELAEWPESHFDIATID